MIYYESPIGILEIETEQDKIVRISIVSRKRNTIDSKISKEIIKQLAEYFNGERKTFDLLIDLKGTEFQKKVWNELLNIPYGTTKTYKQIAELVGNPKGCRAIGNANNKNPIMILVPCHRVVGTNGSLVGYAGGLDIKKKLLELESI